MKIVAEKLEKKFRRESIFSNFSCTFESNNSYALTGPNGSGKSTLLKILSQYSLPTKGSIQFLKEDHSLISSENAHKFISYAAPYVQLIEEFSLIELLEFTKTTGLLPQDIHIQFLEDYLELKPGREKYIQNYSSGMRQKVKLGLSFLSNRPILLLDEPCTNLDKQAKEWFFSKINQQKDKLIIIASNEMDEISFCNESISILDYKS